MTFLRCLSAGLLSLCPVIAGEDSAVQVPDLVAHRGASYDAPENTLPAFELAWKQGADAIEGDFYLSRDHQIVCFHDKTLERVTEGKDKRKVDEVPFEELRRIDVGKWKGDAWAGTTIPTLREVLATVPAERTFLIEIKCGPEIVPVLKRDLEGARREQLRIISFNKDVIATCRKELPGIKAYWLTSYKEKPEGSGKWTPSFDEVMATLKRTDASGLDSNAHETLDEAKVRRLREADYEFHIWTVNDVKTALRFIQLGVDSITTDRPQWLREQLLQKGG